MGIWYCTREDVKSSLDFKETARNNSQVDRAIEAASRSIERLCHRVFYPTTTTRYFRWPSETWGGNSWRLWLDADELISISALTSGGVSISTSDTFLEPNGSGPPYTNLQLNLDGSSSFGQGSTPQRDIAVTGDFGYANEEQLVGTASSITDSATTLQVSDGSAVGVGDVLRIESERMIVAGRGWTSVGNTTALLSSNKGSVTVQVVDGTAYNQDEVILLDSEKLLIVDIIGNNLTVIRAWDGSVLAEHASITTVYVSRVLTVTRAATGTTAAAHSATSSVYKYCAPAPVRSLCIAEAISQIQQESSGYGRTVGSGDNQREASGVGLVSTRQEVYQNYGRKARIRSV